MIKKIAFAVLSAVGGTALMNLICVLLIGKISVIGISVFVFLMLFKTFLEAAFLWKK